MRSRSIQRVAASLEKDKKAAKLRRDSRTLKMVTTLTYDWSSLDFACLLACWLGYHGQKKWKTFCVFVFANLMFFVLNFAWMLGEFPIISHSACAYFSFSRTNCKQGEAHRQLDISTETTGKTHQRNSSCITHADFYHVIAVHLHTTSDGDPNFQGECADETKEVEKT